MKNVGEIIRLKRVLMGLSQGELAEKAGKRQATISEIEAGKRQGELPTLVAIAKVLKIPLSEIVEDLQTTEGTKGLTMKEEEGKYELDAKFAMNYINFLKYSYQTSTDAQKKIMEDSVLILFPGERGIKLMEIVKKSD